MARRLTGKTLKGIWAGAPLSWDEDYQLDERAFRENLRRLVAAKAHGIYVFGSTGEFYAVDYKEFQRVVDTLMEEVGPSGIPTQVGCNDVATHKVIRKLKYVADQKVSGAQAVVPFWMKLTEEEVLQFWSDISQAVPDLPLISYNVGRAKWYLYGEQYRKIIDVAPNLIGIKWSGADSPELSMDRLTEAIAITPELAHFVGDDSNMLAAMRFGVQGCYSSWVLMNPELTIKRFTLAEEGRWEEAEAVHQQMAGPVSYIEEMCEEFGLGMKDPVVDKGSAAVPGFLTGHQRTRPPYMGWPDEAVQEMRARLRQRFPEFVCD